MTNNNLEKRTHRTPGPEESFRSWAWKPLLATIGFATGVYEGLNDAFYEPASISGNTVTLQEAHTLFQDMRAFLPTLASIPTDFILNRKSRPTKNYSVTKATAVSTIIGYGISRVGGELYKILF